MAVLNIFSPYPSNLNSLTVQTCPVGRAQDHLCSLKLWMELLVWFSDNSYVIPILRYWINPVLWGRIREEKKKKTVRPRRIWEVLKYNPTHIMWQNSVWMRLYSREIKSGSFSTHPSPLCDAQQRESALLGLGRWTGSKTCVSHINKAFCSRSTWNIWQSVSHYRGKRRLIITKFLQW